MPARRVLIAGISTRGLAESAARAGYEVSAVDGFRDLDLSSRARWVALARDGTGRFSPRAAVRAAAGIGCDAVVYVGSFENHPQGVAALGRGRVLWGNTPAVLRRVRDPRLLTRAVQARGLPAPAVRLTRPPPSSRARWLVKPRASGGGHAVRPWRGREPLPARSYLQERIAGVAGSIVFAADGRRAVPLGLSRLLAGERAFGAGGYRYCGNILVAAGDPQFALDAELCRAAAALAAAVTEAFRLVGANGVDFIARHGVPYAVEVNPRYTAAMELVERAYGLSIFDIHAHACAGELPAFDLAAARRTPGASGKAIVYARRDLTVGDTRPWLEDATVRDVPQPGARIARGRPVCTVFARGRDAASCHARLVERAARVYRAVAGRQARVA